MPPDDRQPSTRQETLTVLCKVEREDALRRALASLRPNAFVDPALGIHFARVVVIPADPAVPGSSAWLAFESNFDTPEASADAARAAHLDSIAPALRDALGAAFAACEGLAPGASPANLSALWKNNLVPATASYQGHADRDIPRIRLEQRLRDVVLTFFEAIDRASPQELFERARKHVRERARVDPLLAGLDVDRPAPPLPDPDVRSRALRDPILPWVLDPRPIDTLSVVANIPRALLDWQRRDRVYDVRAHQESWTDDDRRAFREIAASEDHGTQNALTHVVPVRAGAGRLATLKHAHAMIDALSRKHFQYVGQLGSIPSIHFAKWLLFDADRRLLFFSNYDKSWESYLGDFVDKAPEGLNLAWSCTEEYPRTVALAFEGAKDEETFKAWGRAYQVPTQVFFSAYPDLTIETINNNTWIRHRLHQPASAGELDTWFRRLT